MSIYKFLGLWVIVNFQELNHYSRCLQPRGLIVLISRSLKVVKLCEQVLIDIAKYKHSETATKPPRPLTCYLQSRSNKKSK